MNVYSKIWLVAGLCTTTYLLVKFVKTCLEQEPKKKSKSKKVEGKSGVGSKSRKKAVSFDEEKSGESKRKRREEKSEEDTATMKIARPKPNFFIGIPVFNREIHENVKKFQEMVIKKNPLLHPALVPISTLHITLAVTHLASETEIKTLKGKLDEWSDKNLKSLVEHPMTLTFDGVNTFYDLVAYVGLKKCQGFQKLCELSQAMNDVIMSAGFSNENRKFTPHLTVLKLSKDYNLLRSKKNFKGDFDSMKQYKEYFGKQEVKCIQLLSMNEPKGKNGYYKCYHQIKISDCEVEADHSVCCNPIPVPKINEEET